MMTLMTVDDFWNRELQGEPRIITPAPFLAEASPEYRVFLSMFPDVKGMDVLDIGCGNGELSVYLARLGANVSAIDTSRRAIDNTRRLAAANSVHVDAKCLNALDLEKLDRTFELVTGTFILHHIEPFEHFADVLARILAGRGLFYENSFRNPILRFFRDHVVGRFGVPKYGDAEEVPLSVEEIRILHQRFDVEVVYPGFVFFALAAIYLMRENPLAWRWMAALDHALGRISALRRYSYHQVISIRALDRTTVIRRR